MKIIEDNEKVLKIERNRGIIGIIAILILIAWGTLFSGAGILFAMLLGGRTSFTCQKTENNGNQCQILESNINSTKTETIPGSIKKAEVDVKKTETEEGSSYSYSNDITLIAETKEISLDKYFSSISRSEVEERVNKINNFLQDPNQKSLTINKNEALAFYIAGGIFALAGLFFVFLVGIIDLKYTLLFKKSDRQLEIKRLMLLFFLPFGNKKYSFSDIDSFLTETETEREHGRTKKEHTLQIKFKSGHVKNIHTSRNCDRIEEIADRANSCLQKQTVS